MPNITYRAKRPCTMAGHYLETGEELTVDKSVEPSRHVEKVKEHKDATPTGKSQKAGAKSGQESTEEFTDL